MVRLIAEIKNKLHKLASVNVSEHDIALGFAVGTFISITIPVVGFLVGIVVAFLFRWINKLSLFGSIVLWNPFFLLPIYTLSYIIGDFFFKTPNSTFFQIKILNQALDFSRKYLIGNLILAVSISMASYVVVKFIASEYRKYQKSINA